MARQTFDKSNLVSENERLSNENRRLKEKLVECMKIIQLQKNTIEMAQNRMSSTSSNVDLEEEVNDSIGEDVMNDEPSSMDDFLTDKPFETSSKRNEPTTSVQQKDLLEIPLAQECKPNQQAESIHSSQEEEFSSQLSSPLVINMHKHRKPAASARTPLETVPEVRVNRKPIVEQVEENSKPNIVPTVAKKKTLYPAKPKSKKRKFQRRPTHTVDLNDDTLLLSSQQNQPLLSKPNDLDQKPKITLGRSRNAPNAIVLPKKNDHAYVEVVRKKEDRAELPAHDCPECKAGFAALRGSGLNFNNYMQNCSRHRAAFEPYQTPEGYWDLDFADSQL